jgi:hypothetical protein
MRHWTFWEWVAYGALFIAAMVVAADTGVRISPELAVHLPPFIHGVIWGTAPLAFVLLATTILVLREFFFKKHPSTTTPLTPQAIPTRLQLQFHPDSITPDALHLENIWRWYTLCNVYEIHEPPSKQHKEGRIIVSKNWAIFIVCDKPVAVRQVLARWIGVSLPRTEVKDQSYRHAIITTVGDPEGAALDIRVVV